jgi:4-hydroxybenzoate polyprenyltransferase
MSAQKLGAPTASWGYFKVTVALLRVSHWVKNIMLFVPIFYFEIELPRLLDGIVAFVAFSLATSSGYIVNDYKDRHSDAQHPVKGRRPVASGNVSSLNLQFLFLFSFISSLILSANIGHEFFKVICGYLVLTFSYTAFLKNHKFLRLVILPFFFIFRLLAGVTLVSAQVSMWFFVLAFLLLAGLGFLKSEIDAVDYSIASKDWQSQQKWKLVNGIQLIFYIALVFGVSALLYSEIVSNTILRNPALIFMSVFQVFVFYFLIHYYAFLKRKSLEPIILCCTTPIIAFAILLTLLTSWKTRF